MKALHYSILTLFILIGNCLAAAVPTEIHYQGRLVDGAGNPIDGSANMSIHVYDAPTEGNLLYGETIGVVPVNAGVYEFTFGSGGYNVVSTQEVIAETNQGQDTYINELAEVPIFESLVVTDGTYTWSSLWGTSDPGLFEVEAWENDPEVGVYYGQVPYSQRTIYAYYDYESPLAFQLVLESGSDLYLQLTVDGIPADSRTRILTVPYALFAHRADIEPGAVTEAELADNSVTSFKIAFGAVNSTAIADGSINHEDLNDGAGSQMDADMLDGLDSSMFLKTIGGNSILGTLNVSTTSGTAGYFQTSESGQSAIVGIASMSPATGFNAGGSFQSNGSIGYGVRGLAYGSSGKGVVGRAEGSGTGGHFSSASGPGLVVSSGRVGLGTESPAYSIHSYAASGDLVLRMDAAFGDSDIDLNSNNSAARPAVNYYNGGTYGGSVGYSVTNDYIFIYQDGNVIVKDGNLGVGTTSPSARADIVGDLEVTGAYKGTLGPNNGAPFPRPAYDSGWLTMDQNRIETLTHNIGGSVDEYVVDMMSNDLTQGWGINNVRHGLFTTDAPTQSGAFYYNLTTSQITVKRTSEDTTNDQVRIRIWVVK